MKIQNDEFPMFDLKSVTQIKKIFLLIEQGISFGVKFYFFDDVIIKEVRSIIEAILLRANKGDLVHLLYSGLKEIIINGIKANLKRVIFLDNHISLNNPKDLKRGMKILKEQITTYSPDDIEKLLIDKGYILMIKFFLEDNGLRIEVLNNCELSEIEENRIRDKFRKALKYDNVMAFINEYDDDLEGAGVGIFLFVLMLKKMGINPNYFRVGKTDDGYTISRIEIPFNESYVSIREK